MTVSALVYQVKFKATKTFFIEGAINYRNYPNIEWDTLGVIPADKKKEFMDMYNKIVFINL